MNDTVREKAPAYDYAGKQKQYRDEWGAIGVSQMNMMLPNDYKDYFKAMGKLLMAKKALEVIEDGDEEILNVLANRQIRLGVDRTQILELIAGYEDYNDDADIKEQYTDAKTVLELFDLMCLDRGKGTQFVKDGLGAQADYWWARECALALYISGAIDLIKARDSAKVLTGHFKI